MGSSSELDPVDLIQEKVKTKLLTERMFLTSKWELREPEILSVRDERYKRKHTHSITTSDVKTLCEILQHPANKIFTENHVDKIYSYGSITIDGKKYKIDTHRAKAVLLDIHYDMFNQNEVLQVVSKKLSKYKSDELKLKVRAYNHLIEQGYMQLIVHNND